jgi:hypothetical protein
MRHMPQAAVFAPLLSERDDADLPEGGIDPLGLYLIADSLGIKLIPGIRERQAHPRFMTAMAVSLEICREFDDEIVAADQVTEPWLVFEWYVVEGLVRTAGADETIGLPGSLKAKSALADRVPLSPKRYLKTPSIFGFHGVYRLLARTLGIESSGRLGDAGYQLLDIWSREQGLAGFIGTSSGPGTSVRRNWIDAARDGLANSATARSSAWQGWEYFNKHLGIYRAGTNERKHLTSMLLNDAAGFRREVIEFLISPAGGYVWKSAASERSFHAALRPYASERLKTLLDAIDVYENFSRLCQDAFEDMLCEMTRQRGKTSPSQLARIDSVALASRQIPEMFREVFARLEPLGEATRFHAMYANLSESSSAAEWAERLAEHHRKTQRLKPPDGKNPWFERFDDGNYIIRPLYRRDRGGAHDDSYLHAYRTGSLWSFANDLLLVSE